jgi:Raf kinase inhibitor-like YbhB/YbcL family protein
MRLWQLACWLLTLVVLSGCQRASAADPTATEVAVSLELHSLVFGPGETIPRSNTCDGADQSPALSWAGVPAGTRSLALIVEDPDAPGGTFTHWVIYNLPPDPASLAAGVPKQADLPNGGRQGRNDFRRVGYGGPCPPPGPAHHYHFHLFALDAVLGLTPGGAPSELRSAMRGHILGESELIGVYGR